MRHEICNKPGRYHSEQTIGDLARAYEIPVSAANVANERQCDPEVENGMDPDWRGGIRTRADVARIMSEGWREGAEKVLGLARDGGFAALPGVRDRRRRVWWSDSGDEIHVDRALQGEWDRAWRASRREETRGTTTIDLYAAWGGGCRRSAEEMMWSGVQMLVAADLLEAAGYRVRVVATISGQSQNRVARQDVIVKSEEEPVRIDALAGILCHAGIFRTAGFREICRVPWNVGTGLGTHIGIEDLPKPLAIDSEAIIMPDAYDRATAARNISRVIEKIQGASPA